MSESQFAPGPVGGVDYPRTYQEFSSWFRDDVAFVEYLCRLRWPNGFVCPRCGVKTSATAGTIFHRSHTSLSTWFAAIWFVTAQKTGVSAAGLQNSVIDRKRAVSR